MPDRSPPDVAIAGEVAFELHGVRIALGASDQGLLERVGRLLPPGCRGVDPASAEQRFALVRDALSGYRVVGGDADFPTPDLDVALQILDTVATTHLALNAVGKIFIHAGAVGVGGQAIVIPGISFSGKTSLVAALVAAGATYYSDEYAVLDARGYVHPYARALSIRGEDRVGVDHAVEQIGGVAGVEALPIGAVVVTAYRPGAVWAPTRATTGRGVIALLEHCIPVRPRPDEALPALRAAAEGAVILEGERGEAADAAGALMALVGGD
jgi:hypothetical protein